MDAYIQFLKNLRKFLLSHPLCTLEEIDKCGIKYPHVFVDMVLRYSPFKLFYGNGEVYFLSKEGRKNNAKCIFKYITKLFFTDEAFIKENKLKEKYAVLYR